MSKTSPFRVFSGTNSRYLAEKICNSLGCKLGNMNIMHFADGEFAVIDKKVIALGGIDEENLLEVKDFGFGGAAILGALWNKFDACTDRDYRCVIEHFRKLRDLAD